MKIGSFSTHRRVKWPQNVHVLIELRKLFFLSASHYLLWEKHSGIKSPGGGVCMSGSPWTKYI